MFRADRLLLAPLKRTRSAFWLAAAFLVFAQPALAEAPAKILLSQAREDTESGEAHARLLEELRVEGYVVAALDRDWRCSKELKTRLQEAAALAAVQVQQEAGELTANVCILRPFDGLLVNASPTRRTQNPEELSMAVLEALHGGSLREELRFAEPANEEGALRVSFVEHRPAAGLQLGAGIVGTFAGPSVSPLWGPLVFGEYTFSSGVRLGAEVSAALLGGSYELSQGLPSTELRGLSPRLRIGHTWWGRTLSPFVNLLGGVLVVQNTRDKAASVGTDSALLPVFGASFGAEVPVGDVALRAEVGVAALTQALVLRRDPAPPLRVGVPTASGAIAAAYRF